EDGIRDFHVTGVQTCALPIFDFERDSTLDTPYEFSQKGASVPKVEVDRNFNPFHSEFSGASYNSGHRNGSSGAGWESLYTGGGEIGRASCRERGESGVAAVAM